MRQVCSGLSSEVSGTDSTRDWLPARFCWWWGFLRRWPLALEDWDDCDLRDEGFFLLDFLFDFFVEGAIVVVVVVGVGAVVLGDACTVTFDSGLDATAASGIDVTSELLVSLEDGSNSTESIWPKMKLANCDFGVLPITRIDYIWRCIAVSKCTMNLASDSTALVCSCGTTL